MCRKKSLRKLLFLSMVIFLICFQFNVQGFNIKEIPRDNTHFHFTFTHPFFTDDSTVTFLSGVYDFALSKHISKGFYLDFHLPLVHINNEYGQAESKFGNLYIGMQKVLKRRDHFFSISLGGQLATSNHTIPTFNTQFFTTNYRVLNAYDRGLTFYGNVGWEWQHQSGWFIKAETGPHLVIITDTPYPVTSKWQWHAHLGAAIGFIASGLRLGVELVETILLTGSFENSYEYIYPSLTFEIQSRRGPFKPGLFFTINLNKRLKEFVNYCLGLKIEFGI